MKHSVLSNLNFRRGVSPLLFLVYNNEDNGVGLEKPYILWQTSSPCPEGRLPTIGFLLQLKSLGEWDTGMFFFCFLKASEDGRDSLSVLFICRNEMEISLKSLSLTQVHESKDQSSHLAFSCTINGIGLLYFNLWPVLVEN